MVAQAEFPLKALKRGGRPQTTTVKAWISKRGRSPKFQSNVYYLGVTTTLVTGTIHRAQALDFNRSHMVAVITRTAMPPLICEEQTELDLPSSRLTVLAASDS